MKKTLFSLFLFLMCFSTEANPLFYPIITTIVVKDRYEYFYDSYGQLIGCEDIASAGYFYNYNGIEEPEHPWEEGGYFIGENGWSLYYWNNGTYLGKCKPSYEYVSYERAGKDVSYTIETRVYVDHKNRPIATYRQVNNGDGDFRSLLKGQIPDLFGSLSEMFGIEKSRILVLQGKVRRYNDW